MSIEIKQLIIKTTVKDDMSHSSETLMSENELDEKLSRLKNELAKQIQRVVDKQMRKAMEP